MAFYSSEKQNLLTLEPQRELKFKGPFTEPVPAQLRLINPTSHRVTYKIKTTAPNCYCVKPTMGVINPGSVNVVTIVLQPLEMNLEQKLNHKFLIQSVIIPYDQPYHKDAKGLETLERWWKTTDREQIMESKIKCVHELPCCTSPQYENMKVETLKRDVMNLVEENEKLKDECTEIRRAMNIATTTMSEPFIDQSVVGHFLTTNSIVMSSIIFVGFFLGALARKLFEEYD